MSEQRKGHATILLEVQQYLIGAVRQAEENLRHANARVDVALARQECARGELDRLRLLQEAANQ